MTGDATMNKFYVILHIFILIISQTVCQECVFKDENGAVLPQKKISLGNIKKNYEEEYLSQKILTENVVNFMQTLDGCKYVNTQFNNDTLTFQLKQEFREIDEFYALNNTSPTEITCTFNIFFDCKSSKRLETIFQLVINDYNSVPPAFEKDTYEFVLPMPFGKGISLTNTYDMDIFALDTDFSTAFLTFKLEPSDVIEVVAVPEDSANKKFRCAINTIDWLDTRTDMEFTLTATDNGPDPGPLSGSTVVKIKPDLNNSRPPEPPQFTEPLTEIEVPEDAKLGDVVGSVTIVTTAGVTISTKLTSNDGGDKYLTTAVNQNKIDILLHQELDENVPVNSLVTLEAWYNVFRAEPAKSKTVLSVKFPAPPTTETTSTTDGTTVTDESTSTTDGTTVTDESTSTTDGTTVTDGSTSTTDGTTVTDGSTSTTDGTTVTDGSTDTSTGTTVTDGSTGTSEGTTSTDGNSGSSDGTTVTDGSTGSSDGTTATDGGSGTTSGGGGTKPPGTNPPGTITTTPKPSVQADDRQALLVSLIVVSVILFLLLLGLVGGYFLFFKKKYMRKGSSQWLPKNEFKPDYSDPPNNSVFQTDSGSRGGSIRSKTSLASIREEVEEPIRKSDWEIIKPEESRTELASPEGLSDLLGLLNPRSIIAIPEEEEVVVAPVPNLLEVPEVKTRKRSITFTENDDEARVVREEAEDESVVDSGRKSVKFSSSVIDINEDGTKEERRRKSSVFSNGEDESANSNL